MTDNKSCPKCGHTIFNYKMIGPHTGQYCASCGIWIKWVPKRVSMQLQSCKNIDELPSCEDYDDLPPWEE